ncbi:hypothetical protein [Pseudoxanthomonas winnipegensis]|uniref:hypothetical protein n=1 Tax=Pseudoxanthomonas winnipegensis TaxID=2480810 RepID=UPI003F85BE48
MFINCPTLSTDAAAYLLLAQNKFQTAIQYEIVHYWIFGHTLHKTPSCIDKIREYLSDKFTLFDRLGKHLRTKLELLAAPQFKSLVAYNKWYEPTSKAIADYDHWFAGCAYNKFDSDPCPTIVITETQIEGGYIGLSRDNTALISLAKWKNYFRPGSALEYLLCGVQRYALRLSYGSIGSHYVTRGCIWDFHVHQLDSRISGYLGFLCSKCESLLESSVSPREMKDIKSMISNDWIGSTTDLSSVASIMSKNYRYDLKRSSGLSSSLMTTISNSMKTEVGKFFFDIAKVALAALATLYIATHFPDWYKLIQGK